MPDASLHVNFCRLLQQSLATCLAALLSAQYRLRLTSNLFSGFLLSRLCEGALFSRLSFDARSQPELPPKLRLFFERAFCAIRCSLCYAEREVLAFEVAMAKQRTFLGIKVITAVPRPNWRTRLGLFLLIGALLGFVVSAAGNVLMASFGLYFNTSDSLPYGLYRAYYRPDVQVGFFALEQKGAVQPLFLERGSLVLVCLPQSVAQLARTRNYVNAGKCPGNTAPVGKHVVALAGDRVLVDVSGVKVNGTLLPHSAPVVRDATGAQMPGAGLTSSYVLRPGEYLVLNALDSSFDSRYFGVVHDADIVATLEPVFTF